MNLICCNLSNSKVFLKFFIIILNKMFDCFSIFFLTKILDSRKCFINPFCILNKNKYNLHKLFYQISDVEESLIHRFSLLSKEMCLIHYLEFQNKNIYQHLFLIVPICHTLWSLNIIQLIREEVFFSGE